MFQNEELQRNNWKLTDENQRLSVKLMDDDRSSMVSRRPGDGGSEEHSARSSLAGELSFQRLTTVRQTYHGQGTHIKFSQAYSGYIVHLNYH